MSSYSDQTYYELLEVSPQASLEEIQVAYRIAKTTYSPDSPALYTMFSREETLQLNQLIDEAYKTLSNHAKRREYDNSLSDKNFDVFQDKTNHAPSAFIDKPNTKVKLISDEEKKSFAEHGVGITRFGQYVIDPILEQEINEQPVFDGTFLKKIRLYKNVELDIMCEHLKISKHHFIAIEENNFSKLPATVFVRSYVKQYANVLELDSSKVTDSYLKILKDIREENQS